MGCNLLHDLFIADFNLFKMFPYVSANSWGSMLYLKLILVQQFQLIRSNGF